MKIELKRFYEGRKYTLGLFCIDGIFECFALEDTVRVPFVKVAGETAIPEGTYKVILDMSQRFGKIMPHILDVPQFEGIRIHAGNTAKDTEGCILLGTSCERMDSDDGDVGKSLIAFNAFFGKLQKAIENKEEVSINIHSI
jgi:hypothetical protein